jgi:hypothetical protein
VNSRFASADFRAVACGDGRVAAGRAEVANSVFLRPREIHFVICDMQFPSASRGVAVGVVRDAKREEPMSVVTADGGLHWQPSP